MLIRCKLGPQTSHCGGHTYDFAADAQGRAVAEVHNAAHVKCFLAVEHYEEVVDATVDLKDDDTNDLVDGDPGVETPSDGAQSDPGPQRAKRGRKSRSA